MQFRLSNTFESLRPILFYFFFCWILTFFNAHIHLRSHRFPLGSLNVVFLPTFVWKLNKAESKSTNFKSLDIHLKNNWILFDSRPVIHPRPEYTESNVKSLVSQSDYNVAMLSHKPTLLVRIMFTAPNHHLHLISVINAISSIDFINYLHFNKGLLIWAKLVEK